MSREAAVPFLFDRDFGEKRRSEAIGERELAQATEAAFAKGEEAGRASAMASATARLAALLEVLGGRLAKLEADAARRAAEEERTAAALALAIGERLAGAALAQFPLAEIERLAAQCFAEARSAPHLAVTVAADLVEAVDQRLGAAAAAAGFAGRLVVLGDPDLQPGDARLEWADGGMSRDGAAIAQRIGDVLARHLPSPDTTRT
jgi:flagellar assembly protein FliH